MLESPAYAQAAGAASGSSGAAFFFQMVPLLAIFVIFWFLLIRPQQRRMKEHQAKIGSVKKGDTVVTGGGLIGRVTKVKDNENEIEVELAPGVNVRVVRSTITSVVSKTEPAKALP